MQAQDTGNATGNAFSLFTLHPSLFNMELLGIHHLTAVSGAISDNLRFCTQVLGLRLVKRTVNQDDVSAYHLFYADGAGSPGTDLTFFDWNVPREKRGTRSIVRTGLRVNGEDALEWWAERLADQEVTLSTRTVRDGRATLDFEDDEGQRYMLVDDDGAGDEPVVWDRSPVPPEYQLRGLGPIVLSVPDIGPTRGILVQLLGMREAREYSWERGGDTRVTVFEMGPGGGPHLEVHLAEEPGTPPARAGAGGVHHVAFRVRNEEYDAWSRLLNEMGIRNSGPIDRYYFRSLYFREPNGILFELASEGPGFTVDEDPDTLGETLVLPPFLESQRKRIVAGLKALPE